MEVTTDALKFKVNFNPPFPCTQVDFVLCYNIPSQKTQKGKSKAQTDTWDK